MGSVHLLRVQREQLHDYQNHCADSCDPNGCPIQAGHAIPPFLVLTGGHLPFWGPLIARTSSGVSGGPVVESLRRNEAGHRGILEAALTRLGAAPNGRGDAHGERR